MDGARTVAKHSQNPSVLHVPYVLPQRIVGGGYGEKKNGMGDPLTSDHGRQHLCGSKRVSWHLYVVILRFCLRMEMSTVANLLSLGQSMSRHMRF